MRAFAAQLVRRPGLSLSLSPRLRRRLVIAGVALLALAALYMLWFRDSSFVAVQDVTVTGLTSEDAERVRAALEATGREMTTLHVDREALDETAAAFSTVARIDVSTEFPHGLRVHVVEHEPAALLVVGERRVPVAGDGSVLEGLPLPAGGLPEVRGSGEIAGGQLAGGSALDSVRVAAGAPGALRPRLDSVVREKGQRGIVVTIADGPELIFGTAARVGAKWAAAQRVLADPDASGAEYIDVRLPERPAAGGLPVETVAPVAPAGEAPPDDPSLEPPAVEPTAPPDAEAPSDPAVGAPVEPQQQTPPPTDPAAAAPGANSAPPAAGGVTANPQP